MEGGTFDGSARLIPAEYEAPRELEHPLHSIKDVTESTLVWIQPNLMRPAYELWAAERVLATLRFKKFFYDQALAASAEGLWTFERSTINPDEIVVKQHGRHYASINPKDHSVSLLTLSNGCVYIWMADKTADSRWIFLNVLGKPVLQFVPECSPVARVRVDVRSETGKTPILTFLALLGKYMLLSRRTVR
jgi:hypothetical protein